jgi:hypothetical protein
MSWLENKSHESERKKLPQMENGVKMTEIPKN